MSELMPLASSDQPPVMPVAEIVVVDDDAPVRETIVALLKRLGRVAVGIDPNSDILSSIAAIRPSIVVLDLSLGRRDAVEILHGLADNAYGGRILLCSGRDTVTLERVRAIGIRLGLQMLAPLNKPIKLRELENSLAEAQLSGSAPAPLVLIDINEAVRQNWLEVWYQPKVTLSSRKLRGAEALVRLRHPQLGVLPPASFLPTSASDAYEAMTGFVISTVARDWGQLRRKGWAITFSVNASISMIQKPVFLQMVRDAWPASVKRPQLIVEITEDELITDPILAQEIATQLKLYDVDISIDDFGAGYSSFATLKKLQFSELKLDKSFVIGCGDNEHQKSVCYAVAAMARQFGIDAVAEGVETTKDLAVIEAAGFEAAQGYLFARPKPLDEFAALLAKLTSRAQAAKSA